MKSQEYFDNKKKHTVSTDFAQQCLETDKTEYSQTHLVMFSEPQLARKTSQYCEALSPVGMCVCVCVRVHVRLCMHVVVRVDKQHW